ncbi:MAG: M48 family metalloprotease, partial [Rhodospirillales bacterium]
MLKRILDIVAVFLVAAVILTGAVPARAQKIPLIRDAEIENTIRQYAAPVFRAAKLDSSAVRIYLVRDNSLNAFVGGGQRLFINTGLLIRSTSAEQIIGVIAHETGHISGGHLARIHEALAHSTAATILSVILGGAAIGAGRGDVGTAIIAGGRNVATRNLLNYTRTQESAADQAALKFLDSAGISAKGFLEFMEILSEQELILPERQDPYVRTHPMAQERVATIAAHVAKSPYADKSLPPEFDVMHRRMRAKLYGYLHPLGRTLRVYKESDDSVESRYARAIGYYLKPDLEKAVSLIDGLIAESPRDPYFWELKGQMLFENGDAKGALTPYETAVGLLPDEGLIRSELARVQLELHDPALLDPAIENLRVALGQNRDSS